MTEKHRDPEYLANARIVRAQVRAAWRHGEDVHCWRKGELLYPGRPFDVGHLDPTAGHGRANLAPECIKCNRSEGGRRGASITNGRAARVLPSSRRASREGLAPW
ncbi:hypothetical protein [Microbacterium oxydans]|uniref:hypothetical protein n=1 Tax=Microbacterium oxydans TaxID=82380 RepID=UPI0024ADD003|nr:hypothetical protein [Microbacterium oxydans]